MPPKARNRRRKRRAPQPLIKSVELPIHKGLKETDTEDSVINQKDCRPRAPAISEDETPVTSQAPSDADSTQPTTPSSAAPQLGASRSQPAATLSKFKVRPVVPIVPVIPAIPQIPIRPKNGQRVSVSAASTSTKVTGTAEVPLSAGDASSTAVQPGTEISPALADETATTLPLPTRAPPKSWADLVRTKSTLPVTSSTSGEPGSTVQTNGFPFLKAGSIIDALSSFDASSPTEDAKMTFIEPRGLVNTGNMCYMNAVNLSRSKSFRFERSLINGAQVLQILLFCVPFYSFLDSVGKRAAHSFKSDTPMLDAM